MFFFDPLFLLFAIPGMLLASYASLKTKTTFNRFSRVESYSGLTGAQAAAKMLLAQGIDNVKIERSQGFLSDHYDPSTKSLRLSPSVYGSTSLSAIGVACHEAGHAIQDAHSYSFLSMRSALVPAVNISSNLAMPILLIGFLFSRQLIVVGIILFAVAVLFSFITLPVEWDASARAKKAMINAGIVTEGEQTGAAAVLDAAFLTYVAAAVSSLMTLLYYLVRSGILGGNDD